MDLLSLVAKLSLDSSEYEKGLGDAENKAGSFGSALKSGLGNIAKVGAAAVGAASAAVGAFAKSSVDAGKNFDSSMSQVAATMGLTMDEISTVTGETDTAFGHFSGTLREFAQYMGANTAFSASQAADALNYMALAGYDAQTSMDMLPNVLNLAAAGGMELATASDMVTDASSALGLSIEDTSTLVDQMAKTSSRSNTSVAQLGEAILTIGATARSVKGGTTELSTLLGVLADNGIKGAEGGTHLRNILISLQTPTKAGTEALEKLNLSYNSFYDSAGNMRSIVDIMGMLQNEMDGLDQKSKDAIVGGIFNKADLSSVNALLGTSIDRFDELTAAIEDSTGAAQAMADTQLDNLAGDVTLFKSALEGVQIAVSDMLTPSLREFVQLGSSGLSEITTALQAGDFSGAMTALGDALSQGIQMIITMLPQMLDAGMQLLSALGQGLLANIPVILDAAVQIVSSLSQFIVSAMPELITAALEIIMALVNYIVEDLPKLMDAAIEIIFALADGIIDAIPDLIPAVVEIILTIVDKLTEPSTLTKMIDVAFKLLGAIGEGLLKAIPKLVEKVPTIMTNFIEAILRFIPQMIASGGELIAKLALGILQSGFEVVNAAVRVISNAGESIMERVRDARQWGSDLIQNFIDGIYQKWESLKQSVANVAQTVRDFLGFSEPKKGPLSNFHTYAPDMMELFARGIKDNEKLITDQINSSFDFGGSISGTPVFSTSSNNVFNINVYGAQGQDEQKLVDILMDEIARRTDRERMAFA